MAHDTPPTGGHQGFMQKHHLLLRRLHSLSGIVPIGVFLLNHLLTNSSIVWGGFASRGEFGDISPQDGGVAYFQKEVSWINGEVPHLLLIEITLWSAIAFHAILGLLYAKSGSNNVASYAYGGNKRYALQRLSGYLGILFIFYHVATLRWGWTFLVPGGTQWTHHFASSTLASALRGGGGTQGDGFTLAGLIVSIGYFVGVSLLVFHFANGLWTAAITWGLTVSRAAQRRWGYACAGLGAGLMLMAWASIIGFAMLTPSKAKEVERGMQRALEPREPGHIEAMRTNSGGTY